MLRLQKVLNHCLTVNNCVKNEEMELEYINFYRRPKQLKPLNKQQTETEYLHDSIQKNEYFLKEIDLDKEKLLSNINKYHVDNNNKYIYSTDEIMDIFILWINTAFKYSPSFIKHGNAVCLSTIDINGYPSSRYVLLKLIERKTGQFIFFTNFDSNKGNSILNISNKVSMTFYWDILDLSVRIKGEISSNSVSDKINDNYWSTRPKKSKLAAITSNQSNVISSKQELEEKYIINEKKYENTQSELIPRPNNWGGFALTMKSIEFWNGDKYRFHDRSVFTKNNNNKWNIVRLQP